MRLNAQMLDLDRRLVIRIRVLVRQLLANLLPIMLDSSRYALEVADELHGTDLAVAVEAGLEKIICDLLVPVGGNFDVLILAGVVVCELDADFVRHGD